MHDIQLKFDALVDMILKKSLYIHLRDQNLGIQKYAFEILAAWQVDPLAVPKLFFKKI